MNSELGKLIREAVNQAIKNAIDNMAITAPYDTHKRGLITATTTNGYTVKVDNRLYANVPIIESSSVIIGDVVEIIIPNGQMSQMYISGKLANVGGGDSPTSMVTSVNGKVGNVVLVASDVGALSSTTAYVSSVNDKTGEVFLDKADIGLSNVDNTADSVKSVNYANTSGSATMATQDANGNVIIDTYATKSEISDITDNMVDLTTEQTISGDKKFTNASGISTNRIHNLNGNAVYDFDGTNVRLGQTTLPLHLRGKDTRPKYTTNGTTFQELARYSDIPTVGKGVLTLTYNGTTLGTFSANATSGTTIDLSSISGGSSGYNGNDLY